MTALQNLAGQAAVPADENAIRKVLGAYVEKWNAHDMDAWGKLFTDDVDYVNRRGAWWQSNKESIEGHKILHERLVRQKSPMTYKMDVAKVTFLKPDLALVHAT